ncbi:MAG: sortase B protein-sorting domain-containing protein [Bacilli bacterium]
MATFFPINLLNIVDFPTFGLPTIATVGIFIKITSSSSIIPKKKEKYYIFILIPLFIISSEVSYITSDSSKMFKYSFLFIGSFISK